MLLIKMYELVALMKGYHIVNPGIHSHLLRASALSRSTLMNTGQTVKCDPQILWKGFKKPQIGIPF